MHKLARKLRAKFFNRPVKPPYDELVDSLAAVTTLVEDQQLIIDAAEELIDSMWLFDAKGQPAITIKTDDPAAAATIAHRIWELQALLEGETPPVPVFIEGTYH